MMGETLVKSSTMLVTLMWLVLTHPAAAQQPQGDQVLTRPQAEEAVERFNSSSTIRFLGRSGVPLDRTVTGDVAVLGGPFEVGGRVDGDVLVLNGNLDLGPEARITGNVTVIGGRVTGLTDSSIGGSLTTYPDRIRVVERDGLVALSARQLREFGRREGMGRAFITFRAGTNYNRIEGLPVMFGPVFESADPNSLKVEALAIWRTESGWSLDSDRMGYNLLVEQRFGPARRVSLGARLHSEIQPIASQDLTDLESSLATFFLRKDYRDYFERTGWSAFATAGIPNTPVSLRAEYTDEEHVFSPVQSPWTLRRNDDPWRPQPLVAEGSLRSIAGDLTLDTRNDADDPTTGWWIRARTVRGLEGDLVLPAHEANDPLFPAQTFDATPVDVGFTAGQLDLRRYARVGPDSDVGLRLFAGGALTEVPLPPQYQHSLGGEGSLPGYSLFTQDCGARVRTFAMERASGDSTVVERVFPRYGCDRAALMQFEFRHRFTVDVDWGRPDDPDFGSADLGPAWSVFFDVGRGWSLTDPAMDTPWLSDVGLGLYLGDLGFYVARSLRGVDRDFNFFIRLNRRF
jgi:hypothetical protein